MKRLLFSLLMLSMSMGSTIAQVKVLESSQRRAPKWLGTVEANFITVSAEAETQDQAKKLCLERVKQEIVNSVAVTISAQEHFMELSLEENGYELNQSQYNSDIHTIAAQLPYLSGVSLDQKGEIYWELCCDKKDKNKAAYYRYYVKYAFTAIEQDKLIHQYEVLDKEQVAKLEQIRKQYDSFTQIEYISKAITEIAPLINFFADNKRKEEAQALQSSYRKLYSEIAIEPLSNELGQFTYKLVLHGRTMTTSLRPKMKSDYAYNMVYRPLDESCHSICYDYEGCRDADPNNATITYAMGGKNIMYNFVFDVRGNKVHVLPQGTLLIEAQPDGALSIEMSMLSKYATPFAVKALSLRVPTINRQIVIEGIDQHYATKGNCTLRLKPEDVYSLGNEKEGVAQGEISLLNEVTGDTQQIKFSILYKINYIK